MSEREQERESEDAAEEEETTTDPEVGEDESKAADRDPLSGY